MTVLQQRPGVSPYSQGPITLQTSQFASEPSKFGIPVVFVVSKMPPASADMTQGLAARFTPTTGSRIPALSLEQQRRTSQAALAATLQPTTISTQHCRGNPAPSRLRYHVQNCTAMKGMQQNVRSWHCDSLMRCQCETVSTSARRCNYISVCVYKTQQAPSTLELKHGCRLRFSSSRLPVLLKRNVLDSATKKNRSSL